MKETLPKLISCNFLYIIQLIEIIMASVSETISQKKNCKIKFKVICLTFIKSVNDETKVFKTKHFVASLINKR